MTKRYAIHENNSGGLWWLNSTQYDALFAAGWKVDETQMQSGGWGDRTKPFLEDKGDTVPYGWRSGAVYFEADNIREAVESFERVTGEDFFAQGCNCCGVPFSMAAMGDDGDSDYNDYISGSDALISAREPW
jgi:hypothetical protein